MSPIRVIILVVAAVAALLAGFLVNGMTGTKEILEIVSEPVETIVEVEMSQQAVLVASSDLRTGMQIMPGDLRWADWPEAAINPAYITKLGSPDAIEEISGSIVRIATYANEPILPMKIVQKGDKGFMAALLSPGLRAAAVEISPESASAGFILPDDRVDVILTKSSDNTFAQSGEVQAETDTILENVRVLAIDQTFGDIDGMPTITGSTATLELTQDQAEMMAKASRTGTISLTLRSIKDADFNNGRALSRSGILDGESKKDSIVIYRNGKAEES